MFFSERKREKTGEEKRKDVAKTLKTKTLCHLSLESNLGWARSSADGCPSESNSYGYQKYMEGADGGE